MAAQQCSRNNYLIVIHKLLEVRVNLIASLRIPDKLFCGIKNKCKLVHLGLIKLTGYRINVGCVNPNVPRDAAEPLPSILSAHILALYIHLWFHWP